MVYRTGEGVADSAHVNSGPCGGTVKICNIVTSIAGRSVVQGTRHTPQPTTILSEIKVLKNQELRPSGKLKREPTRDLAPETDLSQMALLADIQSTEMRGTEGVSQSQR